MELFHSSEIEFEKAAGEVALPEDPNVWPNEILQELYKQVPYIADFQPNIVMDRVDGERGYALGHVEVMNKTELQPGTSPEALESAGVQQARIPVVVRDRKLQPFDVLVTSDSKMLPLTEERIRQALFRPQAFDITSRSPGDMSMIGQLYPPYRQNYGFGGGGAQMGAGMGKTGSDNKSDAGVKYAASRRGMLERILPTINESDYNKCAAVFSRHQVAVMNSPAMRPSLELLSKFEPGNLQKVASALPHAIRPSVVQVVKLEDGYRVKTASHLLWIPNEYEVDRGGLVRAFDSKIALAADTTGSATMVEGGQAPEAAEEAPAAEYALVCEYGIYEVESVDGEKLTGYVIPNLLDLDGTALPLAMFTDNEHTAVQGEISGCRVGEGPASLHWGGHPQGEGFFARELPDGGLEATIPVKVQAGLQDEGGVAFMAETYDGRPCQLAVQPNIQEITMVEEGRVLIPEAFRWVTLEGAEAVALVGQPGEEGKVAAAKMAVGAVTIRSGGPDTFSIAGNFVDKLAQDQREMLSIDDALFLLGGLGVEPNYALKKLAEACATFAPVQVRCTRQVKTAGESRSEVAKLASDTLRKLPVLRRELWKEAAAIPDPTAVDTVLSLGFINPENITSFIDGLPVLEEAQTKLCELLFASRLGLKDIPSGPVEKAIRSLEEVIGGLKVLAFQEN